MGLITSWINRVTNYADKKVKYNKDGNLPQHYWVQM